MCKARLVDQLWLGELEAAWCLRRNARRTYPSSAGYIYNVTDSLCKKFPSDLIHHRLVPDLFFFLLFDNGERI